LAVIVIPVLVLTVGCVNQIAQTSGPRPGSTMPDTPSEQATPSPAGGTDLTIVINNGSSPTLMWRLTCDPPGGTHPDPKSACRALEANGAVALPPVPEDKACTQIYGGPETATITGTWQGQPVMSRFARNDGCQISRWKLMEGLLPPGGT
jgi:Subtilisin inhibitor-like